MKRILKISCLLLALLIAVSALGMVLWSLTGTYPAGQNALLCLEGSDAVSVTELDNGWRFDGAGEDKAFVFYPGALVSPEAYSPLMLSLAENGIDCFLLKMPLNFAILSPYRAERVFSHGYEYERWYVGGHSLGGCCASMCAARSPEAFDGVVFLASYPNADLSGLELSALSVYGSEDMVLDRGRMDSSMSQLPADSSLYCIDGGNHAGFADYGPQRGDGAAKISSEQQLTDTLSLITDFIS